MVVQGAFLCDTFRYHAYGEVASQTPKYLGNVVRLVSDVALELKVQKGAAPSAHGNQRSGTEWIA